MSLEPIDGYDISKDGTFYVISHRDQEIDTYVPVGKTAVRYKNPNGSFTLITKNTRIAFVNDDKQLSLLEY